jgi:hypothetical protein
VRKTFQFQHVVDPVPNVLPGHVTRLLHLQEESMKKVIRARFSMSYFFRVDSLVEVSTENLLFEC